MELDVQQWKAHFARCPVDLWGAQIADRLGILDAYFAGDEAAIKRVSQCFGYYAALIQVTRESS